MYHWVADGGLRTETVKGEGRGGNSRFPGTALRSPYDCVEGRAFSLIGLLLIAGSIYGVRSTLRFLHDSVAADGVVVRLNAGGSHVQIEFTTLAGEKISYAQNGMIFGYEKGDKVRVLYKAPAGYRCVDSFGALWGDSILPGAMGLVFTTVGFVMFSEALALVRQGR